MSTRPEKINIVILGASGRVGRLVSRAIARNFPADIRVWSQTRNAALATDPQTLVCDFMHNGKALARLSDGMGPIGALINFAGVTPASNSKELGDNTRLAIASLARAVEHKIPCVLLASSAAVYGVPAKGHRFEETDTARPVSAYGIAKLEMEQAAAGFSDAHCGNAPRVTCLRIANVAGADMLLRNAFRATDNAPLILDQFPNGAGPVRSYIGPETLARVVVSLVKKSVAGGVLPRAINIASPKPVAMTALINALKAQGQQVSVVRVPAPHMAVPEIALSTGALEKLHEFFPMDNGPHEIIRQLLALRRVI